MKYRILIQPPVADDLDDAYHWIASHSPARADSWLQGAIDAFQSLTDFPGRCPLAPENDVFDSEVRQLLYGDYRILFTVENDLVRILHIRHGARRYLEPYEM